jgi:hypothetical protein
MKQRLIESWVMVTADKRKAGVLGLLLVTALVLWARAAILGGEPASASAATSKAGNGSSDQGKSSGASPTGEFELAPMVLLPRSRALTRDLFTPGPEFGPQPLQPDQTDATGPKSAPGKDDNLPVSPELRRQELERAVRDEASRLHLSSTMVGSNPVAVIQSEGKNGSRSVLRIGESLDGFELVEVTAREVVLIKNGIRVELSIGRR